MSSQHGPGLVSGAGNRDTSQPWTCHRELGAGDPEVNVQLDLECHPPETMWWGPFTGRGLLTLHRLVPSPGAPFPLSFWRTSTPHVCFWGSPRPPPLPASSACTLVGRERPAVWLSPGFPLSWLVRHPTASSFLCHTPGAQALSTSLCSEPGLTSGKRLGSTDGSGHVTD